jgi:DNA-binding CsgD family transcriptional regulator
MCERLEAITCRRERERMRQREKEICRQFHKGKTEREIQK